MTEVMSITVTNVWGMMEEEEEADMQLPLPRDFVSASPNSRVRFAANRKVVRYPSEQSLMTLDEVPSPTVINDEDDFDDAEEEVQEQEQEEEVQEENDPPKQEAPVTESKADTVVPPETTSNGATKDQAVSNDTQPQERKGWAQRAQVQRYVPRFAPPPPQPEENNGEDEEEEEDDEGGEDDEEGYDSVVEDEEASDAEDTIKKIAEETIFSRQQKLQAIQKQQPAVVTAPAPVPTSAPAPASPRASEQDAMLKTIAHIKDQLRDGMYDNHNTSLTCGIEVEKAEQASKAAAAAAQHTLESNMQLSSRIANMRSFLAVLCGVSFFLSSCGVTIMKLNPTTALFLTYKVWFLCQKPTE